MNQKTFRELCSQHNNQLQSIQSGSVVEVLDCDKNLIKLREGNETFFISYVMLSDYKWK